ncbi:MAG: peptide deformylase [Pelosinus sp.]|nr:peptide deformylase [Pelosinus sp.]
MAILEIRKAGDEVLKRQAEPVTKIDRSIKKLLNDMSETLYHADGVGLAAPQVGVSLKVVVIDVGDGLIELINPVILEKAELVTDTEGCLSIPGVFGEVERYNHVTVEALDRSGKKIKISGSGLLARAFQHEIDHLDGILFIEIAKTLCKGQ